MICDLYFHFSSNMPFKIATEKKFATGTMAHFLKLNTMHTFVVLFQKCVFNICLSEGFKCVLKTIENVTFGWMLHFLVLNVTFFSGRDYILNYGAVFLIT